MNSIIKILALAILLTSTVGCINQFSKPEDCNVITMRVDTIYEGGVKDVAFKQKDGEMAYINRALENGYTLEGLRSKVLNKTITLHLAKTITGANTPHIAQLVVENDTIYSEF